MIVAVTQLLRASLPFALFLLAGCAVQNGAGGKIKVGLDGAELFGNEVSKFPLSDGGEGSLRVLGGRYSIKLQKYFKIIPIENAVTARVVRVDRVGGRTLVVLSKSERNCNYRTQILSIQGSEVLSWNIGECSAEPDINVAADNATFDFVQKRRTVRYLYRDMRLMHSQFATVTDTTTSVEQSSVLPKASQRLPGLPQTATSAESAGIPSKGPHYVPGLPQQAPLNSGVTSTSSPPLSSPSVLSKPAPVVVARNTSVASNARPAAPPKTFDFPVQEQKPVRIVLDN